MKSLLILFFICLINVPAFSQYNKAASLWYAEYANTVDFKTNPPTISEAPHLAWGSGRTSAIADDQGNLLFYTWRDSIFNRFDEVMPGGNNVNVSGSGSPTSVIIPFPGDDKLYYVIFSNERNSIHDTPQNLQYAVVDMTGDGGHGAVVQSRILLRNNTREAITVVKHADEESYWLIAQDQDTDKFFSFLISAAGISGPVTSASGWPCHLSNQMNASPDGRWVARVNDAWMDLLKFNSMTGELTPFLKLTSPDLIVVGGAFSPDSELLYVASVEGEIYQFVVNAPGPTEIYNTKTLIGTHSRSRFADLQLAYDGRIYVGNGPGAAFTTLPYVEKPNVQGAGCLFVEDGLPLPVVSGLDELPIPIQSYLRDPTTLETFPTCLGDPSYLNIKSLGYADSIRWDFGDGKSASSLRETGKTVTHTYKNTGTFPIKIKKYIGVVSREITGTAFVVEATQPNIGADTTLCSGQKLILDAGGDGISWQWSTGEETSSITVESAATYSVAVDHGACIRSDEIIISVIPSPPVSFGPDMVICNKEQVTLNGPLGANYEYHWSTGETIPSIVVSESGHYNLTVNDERCQSFDDVNVIFAPIATPLLKSTTFELNDQMILDVDIASNAADSWTWQFGDGTDTTTNEPSVKHSYSFEGNYSGTLTASNRDGCSVQQDFIVNIPEYVFVPNVFTPNGDTYNEYFEIKHNGREMPHVKIFNRWGDMIFDSQTNGPRWDGLNAEPGIYFYQVESTSNPIKGWVQIVK